MVVGGLFAVATLAFWAVVREPLPVVVALGSLLLLAAFSAD